MTKHRIDLPRSSFCLYAVAAAAPRFEARYCPNLVLRQPPSCPPDSKGLPWSSSIGWRLELAIKNSTQTVSSSASGSDMLCAPLNHGLQTRDKPEPRSTDTVLLKMVLAA